MRTQIEERDGYVFIEGTILEVNSTTKQFKVHIGTTESGATIVSITILVLHKLTKFHLNKDKKIVNLCCLFLFINYVWIF